MKVFLLVLAAVLAFTTANNQIRYDNFQVVRVIPKDEKALNVLQNWQENPRGCEFWTGVKNVGDAVDIMVPPHLKHNFNDVLESHNFSSSIFIENVQELIDNENVGYNSTRVKANRAIDWFNYHTLDDINAWLQELANTYSQVTLIEGGTSYENRKILGIRISYSPDNENNAVFIESNIHAREWITSATTTFIINELLTSSNADVRNLAETHDWYIFPVVNPDGFVYSRTHNRMWRKTRVPYANGCYGADPNRNWGFKFNTGGSSSDPCSETYRGPEAFSEPSTKSLSQYIATIAPKLIAYISFHSYSQFLLLPYGVTDETPSNIDDLRTVGEKAMTALSQRFGTQYKTGNIVDLLYVASGGSMDWVKGTYDTKITYTYELRDTGRYGFLLPASLIIQTAVETLDSVVAIFKEFEALPP